METKQQKLIEICRSYSQKIKTGDYLNADFFASAKCECEEKEVKDKSAELFKICRQEVEKSIREYQSENMPILAQQKKFIANDVPIPEGLEEKKFNAQEKEVDRLPTIEI